jgi:hypothetical protein
MGINFKNLKESGKLNSSNLLPEGAYDLVVNDASLASTSKGGQMIKVTFSVESGKYAGSYVWDQFVISENSLKFLYLFLEAVGSPLIAEENIEESDIVRDIKGRRCTAFVKQEPNNNGGTNNKIKKYAKSEKPLPKSVSQVKFPDIPETPKVSNQDALFT